MCQPLKSSVSIFPESKKKSQMTREIYKKYGATAPYLWY